MYIDHTILCIDDDVDDQELLKLALEGIGARYRIITASDGAEGLERLNELAASGELPCLIILDLNMPRLDGKEALERIKSDPVTKKVPVIIFSTAEKSHQEDFYTQYGAQYFTKPIEYRDFSKMIDGFLSLCWHVGQSQT